MKTIAIALRVTAVTLVLTGLAYPLAVTGLSQVLFPSAASGSVVKDDAGRVVGSRLIGQGFANPAYFQPRPSAAGKGYDAASSGGSNLGTTAAALRDRVRGDVERLRKDNPEAPGPIPAELVTTSASGLDPHLTPSAVLWQLPRVAHARAVAPDRIRMLVDVATEGRDLGVLGEPTVNVLLLNLALDRQLGGPTPAPAAPTPPAPTPGAALAPAPAAGATPSPATIATPAPVAAPSPAGTPRPVPAHTP